MEEEVKFESDEYYVVIVGELEDKSAVVPSDMNDHKLTDESSLEPGVWLNDPYEVKIEPLDPEHKSLDIESKFSEFIEVPMKSPEEQGWDKRVMQYVKAMEAHAKAPAPPLPRTPFTKEGEQFKCVYCEHSCLRERLAIKHYRFRHGKKYHKCLACHTAFRRRDSMIFHEHHCRAENADLVRMAREICTKSKRESLPLTDSERHRRKVLKKKERQRRKILCKICGKQICYGNIWTHMRVHSEVKRFECSHCTASFRTKRAWEGHENAHSGLRPYRCTMCTNAYTSANALLAHKLTHTEGSYNCEHCGQEYRTKHRLKEHIISKHTDAGKYLCNQCGKVLNDKNALEYHTRAHRGDQPRFTCEECGNSYTVLGSLNSHLKAKHGHEIITRKMFFQRLPLMAHVPDFMLELIPQEKRKNVDAVGDADAAKESDASEDSKMVINMDFNGS